MCKLVASVPEVLRRSGTVSLQGMMSGAPAGALPAKGLAGKGPLAEKAPCIRQLLLSHLAALIGIGIANRPLQGAESGL